MLKREYRLPARTKLLGRQIFKTNLFILKISPNNKTYSRFGFVVSKKIAKKAVDRNRARRLLRSCVEERFKYIKGGFDFLFLIRENIAPYQREEVCATVFSALSENKMFQ